MNQNPNTLALAIVHQVVQASELQEAREALQAQAEHLKDAQKAIDTLVADREATKKAHAEHLETVAGQLKAEQDALLKAQIEHNEMMRKVAAAEGYASVESMLNYHAAQSRLQASATEAPAPVDTEGGETA